MGSSPPGNGSRTVKRVLVVIAMEAEASPIIEGLGLKADGESWIKSPAPCKSSSGEFSSMNVMVVHNGKDKNHTVDNVGTVPAALASYLAIQAFKPDLVISAGTAGGFKEKGGQIGDVYISSACMNHDRRIQLPGFKEYGIDLKHSTSTENLQAQHSLKPGIVSTGNSLDYTEKCLEIMKENNATVKEMEAASVAWVADLWDIPMFCLKAITDIVDGDKPTPEEFLQNLGLAAQALKSALPKVLEFVSNKQVSEL